VSTIIYFRWGEYAALLEAYGERERGEDPTGAAFERITEETRAIGRVGFGSSDIQRFPHLAPQHAKLCVEWSLAFKARRQTAKEPRRSYRYVHMTRSHWVVSLLMTTIGPTVGFLRVCDGVRRGGVENQYESFGVVPDTRMSWSGQYAIYMPTPPATDESPPPPSHHLRCPPSYPLRTHARQRHVVNPCE
jgi:hypothetical protein